MNETLATVVYQNIKYSMEPGTVEHRFVSLPEELEKRFPDASSPWSSTRSPESRYLEAIDKALAEQGGRGWVGIAHGGVDEG